MRTKRFFATNGYQAIHSVYGQLRPDTAIPSDRHASNGIEIGKSTNHSASLLRDLVTVSNTTAPSSNTQDKPEKPLGQAPRQVSAGREIAFFRFVEAAPNPLSAKQGAPRLSPSLGEVDEAIRLNTPRSVTVQKHLPLAYLNDGQQVPEDLPLPRIQNLIGRGAVPMRILGIKLHGKALAFTWGGTVAHVNA